MFGLDLPTLINRVIILVIAFTVHEYMHAFVAYKFGDWTAKNAGRLTLNPLVHLDPLGSIMLLFAGFGWAKPVPVNPYVIRQKHPAGLMLVSLAGPLSNLVLAAVGGGIIRLLVVVRYTWMAPEWLVNFLLEFIVINIMLFLFNMIPIAPLDGDKILEYTLPEAWKSKFETVRQYGSYILFGMMIIGRFTKFDVFGFLMDEPMSHIFALLTGFRV
ncbi:MAG TPA: site-2 protease family protein [Anaerolineaceae bacterium]|nr:site-2 protease family protein [Anaerolineaceae bacterium]HQC63786.1 site-2 protease family protein [Anaerolineaceae bacterium]